MSPRLARRAALFLVLLCLLPRVARAAGWSDLQVVPKAGVIVTGTATDRVVGLEIATGRLLWALNVEGASSVRLALVDDRMVCVDKKGRVFALDPRTGNTAWSVAPGGTLSADPQVADGRLLLAMKQGTSERLVALSASDGRTLWSSEGPCASVVITPSALLVAGEAPLPDAVRGIKENAAVTVRSLEPATGAVQWTSDPSFGTFKPPLRMQAHRVVVSTTFTQTAPGADEARAPADREEASTAVFRLAAFTLDSGQPAWEKEISEAEADEPRILSGRFVVVTKATKDAPERRVEAFALADAHRAWTRALPLLEGTTEIMAADLADGSLLVSQKAPTQTRLLRLDGATGQEKARWDETGTLGARPVVVADLVLVTLSVPDAKGESTKPRLVALEPATLSLRWALSLAEAPSPPEAAPADLPAPSVLVQDGDALLVVNATTGEIRKRVEVSTGIRAGPVFTGRLAIAGDQEGALRGFDLAAGSLAWSTSTKPWFSIKKLPNFVFVLIILLLIAVFIYQARGGRKLFIRRIAGLEAIDEAVGRSAEMGKPVMFLTGMTDVDDNQTLSALSILGHVAQRSAEYETRLVVPCRWSVTMTAAQEATRQACTRAGRPDAYQEENVRYVSEDQFGFVAGVDGIMLREKPAANFFMGMYFAESLILAETGYATGAIQIAGSAAAAQLPFFVAACDYTLLGEELFAASAYLSQDPLEMGSLKGQDWAKALIIGVIVVASLLLPWAPQVKAWLAP